MFKKSKRTYQFRDQEHKDFYEEMITKTSSQDDCERKALFYLLGLDADTRAHINTLYDFKEQQIEFEGLYQGWQTSASIRICRLAFNLYNGFSGEELTDVKDYTPRDLFDCGEFKLYMFEAVRIRFD